MRTTPPQNFDTDEFYKGIYTFQKWELFPGISTRGLKDVVEHMRRLQVPERLDGLRVLDIAPWNGFFGFECVRRGAAQVVSLGPDDPNATGYNKTRDLLELDNCSYVRASVYDLSPDVHGKFDVVLFLGLIYHLRHPLLALDRIYEVSSSRLFVDSPTIDNAVFDKTIAGSQRRKILTKGKAIHALPMVYFTKGSETGDPYNWFMPNRRALVDFVESSGFAVDSQFVDAGGWMSLSATKSKRTFTPGLEGWNEPAARMKNPSLAPAREVEPSLLRRLYRRLKR
jgi:tRNA (mo5U34)-methyltransferase